MQKFTKQLLVIQFFGAIMFAVVCASYFLKFLTGDVMHGELAFRIILGVSGSALFVGSIVMLIFAYLKR